MRWVRWSGRLSWTSALSLAGFVLATCSLLLEIGSAGYAIAIGGFRHYDPRLMRIFCNRTIGLLIGAGIVHCRNLESQSDPVARSYNVTDDGVGMAVLGVDGIGSSEGQSSACVDKGGERRAQ